MDQSHTSRIRSPLDAVAAVRLLSVYWPRVVPRARAELRRWYAHAQRIPDPWLRGLATATLDDESLNAEAAAVFAVLVPRRHRRAVVALTVAFQVMYDYLDSLGEEPAGDMLVAGLRAHEALTAVFSKSDTAAYYSGYGVRLEDGDYLRALIEACRDALDSLPARAEISDIGLQAAARCRAAQSLTHSARQRGLNGLRAWVSSQVAGNDYRWWEVASAGISSLAVHALFAAAADSRTTRSAAAAVDAAYFPSVCAVSTLLDSLVDVTSDREAESHSYVSFYTSDTEAAARLGAVTRRAAADARALPRGRYHLAILAGVAAFYLTAPQARFAPLGAAPQVLGALRPGVTPVYATLRVRRVMKELASRLPPRAGLVRAWGHNR
jgi:tetraprenyl-beta-curcumene synthase